MPARADWLTPTIVQLELAKWLVREAGEYKADQLTAFTEKCVVVPLTIKTALAAADVCAAGKLSTADAIVYATAIEHGATLLTCDRHFAGLPSVLYVAKVAD